MLPLPLLIDTLVFLFVLVFWLARWLALLVLQLLIRIDLGVFSSFPLPLDAWLILTEGFRYPAIVTTL